MSCQVIKMTGNHSFPIEELSRILKKELSAELVTESQRYFDYCKVALLVFEKYFFRNGSYANLTIMLTETTDCQTADIVGSGGGEGLFNISWGANTDFAEAAESILAHKGFQKVW